MILFARLYCNQPFSYAFIRIFSYYYYLSIRLDFEAERECLWREIVPELQQFCLNYGAELFVIDPFQSSDKDLTDDPFLLQTLLTEIDQCRQLSAGLFFIVRSALFVYFRRRSIGGQKFVAGEGLFASTSTTSGPYYSPVRPSS